MKAFFYFTFLFALFSFVQASEVEKKASLLVSYSYESDPERLKNLKFWLKKPDFTASLYPKGEDFAEDLEKQTFTIAIENLPLGQYQIFFLLPNKDAHFEDVEDRQVHLADEGIHRIDIHFKERMVVYHSKWQMHDWLNWDRFVRHYIKPIAQQSLTPQMEKIAIFSGGVLEIIANNQEGKWHLYQEGELILQGQGSVSNLLLPAKDNYKLLAFPIKGHHVTVFPNELFTVPLKSSVVSSITYDEIIE